MSDRAEKPDPIGETLQAAGERPIAFWPVLVRMAGTIAAALLLSQILYWWSRMRKTFWKTDSELVSETGLGSKALRLAKDRLRTIPGVKIERKTWPARTFYSIDETTFLAQFSSLSKRAEQGDSLPQMAEQECPKRTNRNAPKGETIEQRLRTDYAQTTDFLSKDGGGSADVSEKKPKKRKPPKTFTPPTREDVRQWIKAHPKYADVDPDKFFDHYAVADWFDSTGKPVLNWQQRVVSWSKGNDKRKSYGTGQGNREQAHGGRGGRRNQNTREPLPTADDDPDAINMQG